ncbi:hypothetical protein DWW31_02510 [Clostridium sp. AF15-17LB]|nr:hypothetical protein DWW31_02510 [Clostridium sp. AF15-17LB]
MNYEERFRKYVKGEIGEEEKARIEEDLNKTRVLLEYLDSSMDETLYAEEEGPAGEENNGRAEKGWAYNEMGRRISRAVNRKLRHYAVLTGAVVLLLVFLAIYALSPVMDAIYYNPSSPRESQPPLDLNMAVYMELVCGDKGFASVNVRPEGYGRHSLDVQTQINGRISHHYLELNKNHLYWTDMSWNQPDLPGNAFTYSVEDRETFAGTTAEEAAVKLRGLSESMVVRAALSFKETKDTEQLAAFMKKYSGEYLYVPFETYEGQRGTMSGYMGYRPDAAGYVRTDSYDQQRYPYLDLAQYEEEGEIDADVLTQHVTSMLAYMKDNEAFGQIFASVVPGENVFDRQQYEGALDYVQKNGVNGYGVVVNAGRDELLQMLSDPDVDGIYLIDAQLKL